MTSGGKSGRSRQRLFVSFSVLLIALVLLLGSLSIATGQQHAQGLDQSSDLLDRQAKRANLENVIVGQAVVNALLDGRVPGGVAKVADCNDAVTYSFRLRKYSLRGVLDSIVATDRRYTWEVKDDVINVIPSNGPPPFLAVHVSRFDLHNTESPEEALSQLLAVPEVKRAQLSLGPRAVQGRVSVFCPQGCPTEETKKISVSLKGATVRECLNAIARAHGNAVWWFRQSECGGRKTFSLDFNSQ